MFCLHSLASNASPSEKDLIFALALCSGVLKKVGSTPFPAPPPLAKPSVRALHKRLGSQSLKLFDCDLYKSTYIFLYLMNEKKVEILHLSATYVCISKSKL